MGHFIFHSKSFGRLPHLNESDLALTNITAGISNGDFPIVLDPALSTENVVDAGRHLVPLIVVSQSRQMELKTTFIHVCLSSPIVNEAVEAHPGRVT